MKTIRFGMFETNSSSTHAFGIIRFNRKGPVPEKIEFNKDQEFGWEHRFYDDPNSKFTYLLRIMEDLKYPDFSAAINLITSALKHAGVKEIIYPDIKLISKTGKDEITDKNDVKVQLKQDDGHYGYVDHGNDLSYAFYQENIHPQNNLLRALLTTEDKIQRFILGNSWITTSNDNDGDGYLLPSESIAYEEVAGYLDEDDPEMEEFNKRYEELTEVYDIYFK